MEELLDSAKDSGSAWDYSRVESNLGFYYLADYYTEKEALDKALEVAKEIQECFGSWDDFVDSYLKDMRMLQVTAPVKEQNCMKTLRPASGIHTL